MISISLPQSDQAYSGHFVNTHNVAIYEASDMRLHFNLSLQLAKKWTLINERLMPRIPVNTYCRYFKPKNRGGHSLNWTVNTQLMPLLIHTHVQKFGCSAGSRFHPTLHGDHLLSRCSMPPILWLKISTANASIKMSRVMNSFALRHGVPNMDVP